MSGLRRSKDRKVTNLVSPNGKTANGANSFGLPSGKDFSCPGQTAFCERICYAGKLETIYKGVRDILMHNWELLNGASKRDMICLLDEMVAAFNLETATLIEKGKNASYDFRIHWDGDFFSREYAEAWAIVVKHFPHIRFWVYTRSFTEELNVIPVIANIPNLTVYLSADKDNRALANTVAAQFPGVFIATVADTFAEAKATIANERKSYNCPENGKRIPLISTKGSACLACGICPAGRGDVLFSASKK